MENYRCYCSKKSMPNNSALRDIAWKNILDEESVTCLLICYQKKSVEAIWTERLGELVATRNARAGVLDYVYAGNRALAVRILVGMRTAGVKTRRKVFGV